jgi:hypothetical protein
MFIPEETDPCWIKAITDEDFPKYELLATKIILGRLTLIYEMDPSPETAQKCVEELRLFFLWNKDLPKAQTDLKKIINKAVNS